MKKYHLIIITSFILINNFFFLNLQSEIINKIVVKVGGSLITSIDIQNEIVTNLVLNKQEIIQKIQIIFLVSLIKKNFEGRA